MSECKHQKTNTLIGLHCNEQKRKKRTSTHAPKALASTMEAILLRLASQKKQPQKKIFFFEDPCLLGVLLFTRHQWRREPKNTEKSISDHIFIEYSDKKTVFTQLQNGESANGTQSSKTRIYCYNLQFKIALCSAANRHLLLSSQCLRVLEPSSFEHQPLGFR